MENAFTFVDGNTSTIQASRLWTARRIRSHAARCSWPGRRQRAVASSRAPRPTSIPGAGVFALTDASIGEAGAEEAGAVSSHVHVHALSPTSQERSHAATRSCSAAHDGSCPSKRPRKNSPNDCTLHPNAKTIRETKRLDDGSYREVAFVPLRSLTYVLSEIVTEYPVLHNRELRKVAYHFVTQSWPKNKRELQLGEKQHNQIEETATRYTLCEPAMFYSSLLMGAADLFLLGALDHQVVGWIRHKLLQAIRAAVDDVRRRDSVALILAVSRLALFELTHGDSIAANVAHLPARKQMLILRGGKAALRLPDPYLQAIALQETKMIYHGAALALIDEEHDP